MKENNIIKSITKHKCPGCGCEVFIENEFVPPIVNSLFTNKDVDKAKKNCLKRVETLTIEDDKKKAVKRWIEDPSTIFNESEVEPIILSLLESNE